MSNDAFIEDAVAAIYERYDIDRVRNAFIHADGGKWIGKLGAHMPNAVFVMDGFHLKKHFKKLLSLEGAEHYAGVVKKAIRRNDLEALVKYCDAINEKQAAKEENPLWVNSMISCTMLSGIVLTSRYVLLWQLYFTDRSELCLSFYPLTMQLLNLRKILRHSFSS